MYIECRTIIKYKSIRTVCRNILLLSGFLQASHRHIELIKRVLFVSGIRLRRHPITNFVTFDEYDYRVASIAGSSRRASAMDRYNRQRAASIKVTVPSYENRFNRLCEHGHFETVKYGIRRGINIWQQHDAHGIASASERGHLHIVDYLMDNRMDSTYRPCLSNGIMLVEYSLSEAIENGQLRVIKYLIAHGADLTHPWVNESVYWAAMHRHWDTVKYMLRRGCNIHTHNDAIIRIAAERRNVRMIKWLIRHGANVRVGDDIVMKQACKYGWQDVVHMLVRRAHKCGVLPAYITMINNAPLRICRAHGHTNLASYLEANGAHIETWTEYSIRLLNYTSKNISHFFAR